MGLSRGFHRLASVLSHLILAGALLAYSLTASAAPPTSQCFGTPANGRITNAVKLPTSGTNFVSYGTIPVKLGRTYVHSKVADAVLDAFAALAESHPAYVFKYAETGSASGGPFKPHKTHQNGLSVDLMVPVLDGQNRSVHLPTHALNRYGYDIEFDADGRWDDLTINFKALNALMLALDAAAEKNGIRVARVLFAPDLQPHLFSAKGGQQVRERITIPSKRSWVRHDEHIHVDFAVSCDAMN